MRYIKDIPDKQYKVGLYQWNGKYIIKFEAGGMYEQIFKLDETDFSSPDEVEAILDDTLINTITERFRQMHEDTMSSLMRNGIIF